MKNLRLIKNISAFTTFMCLAYSQTEPAMDAPTPTADAADVISIFSDAYTDVATNYNPGWGQSGTVNTTFDPTGNGTNYALAYTNFNYQGTELTQQDASAMDYLHVDIWVASGTDRLVKVTPINQGTGAGEFLVDVPLTPGSWNSVDIPKADFTGMIWDAVFQFKFDGQFNGDGSANANGFDVYLDNIHFWRDGPPPPTSFVINDFNTLESATDEGAGAFWVEFDESESDNNFSTLIQIPAVDAPDSDSPVMSWSWGTDGDQGWGGYTSVYHVYDAAVDLSDFNYLSFKFYNEAPPANLGSMAFRVNLFDVSDTTTWETRDDTEVWYSFFEGEANSPFYNVADDGWVEYRIPLQESGSTGGGTPYTLGFTRTGWVGLPGNNAFDKDQIGGLSIEVVQAGVDETNYGEFFLEDIQAIYSADLPGCMDPNSCNYNPDATIDDGSCYSCVDVTFAVNMQNEQVDETGVFLHGSWFGWGTMAMLDDDANGVYEITIPDMTSGSTIEFKFMNGADVEIVPADCENINDWGGGINRMYTLPEADTTIGPICFGGCVDCAPAGPVDVTFNVDMSGVNGFDGTEAPYVFGSFNNWDSFGGQTMLADEDGDNVYTGTVNDLMSDAEITLLFGYGADYETVPEECGILDSDLNLYVRLLPIQDAGGSDVLVLDAIAYGGCPTGDPVSSAQFSVDVSTVVSTFPEGYQVCVTGEFDGWSGWGAVLTDDDGDMVYTGTRSDLVAGTDYQYKFVINGWDSGIAGGAPLGSGCDFIPGDEYDNYGFTAVEGLLELDEVCWGACVTCDQLSNEENSDNVMPAEFSYKMFPNPFNPYINIYYELPISEQVTITILNLLGQEVKTIVNKVHQPGRYSNSWDGKDSYGQVLQSGIYFAVINRQSGRAVSKITFLK